jgi:hypothetical protein
VKERKEEEMRKMKEKEKKGHLVKQRNLGGAFI